MGGIIVSSHTGLWCGSVGTVALPITTSAEILLILLWRGLSAVWYLNQLLQDIKCSHIEKITSTEIETGFSYCVWTCGNPNKVATQKLNTWEIFLTVQRIIIRHLIMNGRERISSRGGLLAVCALPAVCKPSCNALLMIAGQPSVLPFSRE